MEKRYVIVVTSVTEDGDHMTKVTEISESDVSEILPVTKAVLAFKPYGGPGRWTHRHNFPNNEYIRADLGEKSIYDLYPIPGLDLFVEYVSYDTRNIDSIKLYEVVKIDKLL